MAKATKKMGFGSIFLLGINGIIGSGIFLLPSSLFKQAGASSVPIIMGAGLASLVIALCYADLASRIDGDGASWLYSYTAFGRFAGFQVGFFSWIQGVITITAEIAALLNVLKSLFPALNSLGTYRLVGISIIVALALINMLGEKVSTISDNISSVAKLLVLIAVIALGIWSIHISNFAATAQPTMASVGSAFNSAFYMFTGFAFLPIVAADMQNPEKNLPKALITVIVTVSIIYMLVQTVSIGILGSKLATTLSPLDTIFKQLLGTNGNLLIILGMVLSILGVAISVSFSTPYVASSLADEHQLLPQFLGVHTKNGTPWVSILITTTISCLLLLSGSYLFLISCVVLISLIQYIPTAMAVMHFQKIKTTSKGWNLPGGKVIPIIAILLCLYLAYGITSKVWIFGVICVIFGLAFYWLDQQLGRK